MNWLTTLAQATEEGSGLDPGLSIALGAIGAVLAAGILAWAQHRVASKDRELQADLAKKDRQLKVDQYMLSERLDAFASYTGLFVSAASRIHEDVEHTDEFKQRMNAAAYRAALIADESRQQISAAHDAIVGAVESVDRKALQEDDRIGPIVNALSEMQGAMRRDLQIDPE